ncbi:MAG: arginine--tRNA ligase [Bacillales bacterium]|nr:arginine--tRNA ligase [Bacillales bacterium]
MDIELELKTKIKNALNQLGVDVEIPDITIETTKNPLFGDYASNVAMKYCKIKQTNPRDLANKIIDVINKDGIEKIEIAGPGFINFFLEKNALNQIISKIINEDENYGRGENQNKRVNVEFVSANPTGDLHLGHARIAAFGDSICRLYEFAGYDVTREYYINDAGNQINNLGKSLRARYHQAFNEDYPMPEDGYCAHDIIDIANKIKDEYGDIYLVDNNENFEALTNIGMKEELDKIKKDLHFFRVDFDVYTSERDIRKNNHVQEVLENLYSKYTYVEDGATFLKTSDFIDDKDRAVVKSDGSYTYLMPDIAYHLNKLSRHYDLLIDVLGADHHGYINRMKSALMMQGYSKDVLEVELVQVVRLIKDGEEVRMSKRTGTGISLRELCEEVGVDAVRYFFVSRAGSSHLDFDLNLATEQSSSNPVFYAQYAYARLSKVLSLAEDIELDISGKNLNKQQEIDLLKCLIDFPNVVKTSAKMRAPHAIATYIQRLASLIHSFYTECRVINRDDIKVTQSRLALAKASAIVMRNALNIIGVSAPTKM